MSNLVVVGFNEPHKAEEVRLKLQKLQDEHLLDLADVVVAVKDETGKVKLHHAGNLIADTAVFHGFWGSLACLILLNATAGAASGALTDVCRSWINLDLIWCFSLLGAGRRSILCTPCLTDCDIGVQRCGERDYPCSCNRRQEFHRKRRELRLTDLQAG
jgi:hypothetical protein